MSHHLEYLKYIESIMAQADELRDEFAAQRWGLCDELVDNIKDDLSRIEQFLQN